MKISDMELFLRIIQEESLNRAAEKSYMTEAALSQQLKKIENELHADLFFRQKGKKLELTETGTSFQKTAENIIREYYGFLDTLKDESRPLQIGVSIGQSDTAIDVLKTMADDFSPLRYIFVETGHQEREDLVKSGKLDLAYTSLPLDNKNLDYTVVRSQPMGIFLRKGHPMEKTAWYKKGIPIPYIGLEVLNNDPFLLPGQSMPHQRSLVLQILKDHHITPKIEGSFQTLSYSALMAKEGICNSISLLLDNEGIYPDTFFLIDECNITYEMAIAYRKEKRKDPNIQQVIRYFQKYFSSSR